MFLPLLIALVCASEVQSAGLNSVTNLVANGSFEISATGDQPDLVFNDLGCAWNETSWRVRREPCATAPHGGHVFRISGRYRYRTLSLPIASRKLHLAFSARAVEVACPVRWRVGGQSGVCELTSDWRRYSVVVSAVEDSRLEIETPTGKDVELDAIVLADRPFAGMWIPSALDLRHKADARTAACRQKRKANRRSFREDGLPAESPMATHDEPDVRYALQFAGETNFVRGCVFRDQGVLTVKDARGKIVFTKDVAPTELDRGVPFGADLPVGQYDVMVVLRNIGIGRSRPRTIRVVRRPQTWCRLDRFAHMAETEKGAFLPFGVALSHAESWTNRFPEVKERGYNSLFFWSCSARETRRFDVDTARGIFDQAGRCGLDVVCVTPYLTAATARGLTNGVTRPKVMDVPFEEVLAAKREFVSAFRTHPAVRMWNHYDELYNYWWSGEFPKTDADVFKTYREVARIDPCHLQWNNSVWIARNEVTGGRWATDLTVGTVYTLHGVEGVGDTLEEASRLAKLGCPQSYNAPAAAGIWLPYCAAYGESGPLAHEPSPGEIRTLLYGSLIRGVRGFWFYNYRPASDNLWRSGGECAREASSMADVFLRGKHLGAEVDSPDIEAMAYQCGGDVYVLSVNTSSERLCARIKLPEGCRRGRTSGLFEDRSVLFKNYILTDEWEPYARHIYKIGRNKNLSYE